MWVGVLGRSVKGKEGDGKEGRGTELFGGVISYWGGGGERRMGGMGRGEQKRRGKGYARTGKLGVMGEKLNGRGDKDTYSYPH